MLTTLFLRICKAVSHNNLSEVYYKCYNSTELVSDNNVLHLLPFTTYTFFRICMLFLLNYLVVCHVANTQTFCTVTSKYVAKFTVAHSFRNTFFRISVKYTVVFGEWLHDSGTVL